MNQADLVISRENIRKLVEKSVFMPKDLRNKLLKKLANPETSQEKLKKIQSILDKIISTEDSTIKDILKKDPLFFEKAKRQKSREILQKKLELENKLKMSDLENVERELENLLIT